MSTVLVIEDDQHLREGLELLFQIEGYRTLGASNGLRGLDLVRNARPDVVLTNFHMPGANGFDVIRAIRSDAEVFDTPILFLTANHHPSVRREALQTGADAFLTKPFRTEELVRTIAALAARIRQEEST